MSGAQSDPHAHLPLPARVAARAAEIHRLADDVAKMFDDTAEVSRVQEPDPHAHLPLAERITARAADIAELAAHVAGPGAQAADYATAYTSLHEVVRAFLAGKRNTKYLRRMHAEIEAELTGGDRRG